MADTALKHDRKLFDALLDLALRIDPAVRSGSMFGCPAAFHGRKMAACVYGDKIGLKVPEELAKAALASGRAVPFTPYGKAKMREWIMLAAGDGELDKIGDLLALALAYAEANNGLALRLSLLQLDKRATKIFGVEEEHGLAMRAGLGLTGAENPGTSCDQTVARGDDVSNLVADVVDAAIRVPLQEFRDGGVRAERLQQLDFGVRQGDEYGGNPVLRLLHGLGDSGS